MTEPFGEFEFIRWIRQRTPAASGVALSIGDDAALITSASDGSILVTSDLVVEGVHFEFPSATPTLAGRKALAVNLSDIAAMAGEPTSAFISLLLPRQHGRTFAMQVFQGIEGLAAEFDVSIAGGDTNSWSGPLVISITLLGSPGRREPVRRSGAADGDWLMVTGRFGGSRFGRHLTFQPRVHEARKLAECAELHAMIDVSDGLAADLHHILDESRVAGIIEEDAVPISDDARNCLDGRSPLEHALGDGEDFELLFTVSETDGRKLLATQPLDVFVSRIGRVLPGSSCQLVTADGTARTLARLGYSHPIS